MQLITPAVSSLLALATPLAVQAAGTRSQPDDDTDVDTVTAPVEPGVATTVTRTEVTMVPVAVVEDDAEEVGRIEGRHRLHIESDAFAWRRWTSWTSTEATNAARGTTDSLGVLGGAPMFGVPGTGPAGNITLGYGYGIRERVVIGARLGLGWQQFTAPDREKLAKRSVAYNITPYVEFVFRPGYKVRPYLGARIGLGGSSFADLAGDVTTRVSTIGPIFGVSGGLHAFVSERVSLDTAVTFDYALAFARDKVTVSGSNVMNNAMEQKTDFARSARLPNLALVVGLSVWLGRSRTSRDRRDRAVVGHRG